MIPAIVQAIDCIPTGVAVSWPVAAQLCPRPVRLWGNPQVTLDGAGRHAAARSRRLRGHCGLALLSASSGLMMAPDSTKA